jgi:1-acylglycerone phosphate reductase
MTMTTVFSPLLIASEGTIINIGSVSGKAPILWQGYYNASKAAVNAITDQFRIELGPFDVKVISIISSGVNSNFVANLEAQMLPAESMYSPAGRKRLMR